MRIMGVVNATPDSFSDGGQHAEDVLTHARTLVADGADIVDVGGESTRPGAAPVSAEEELRRVLPVVRALAGRVVISVDTYKAEVADAALAAGATIVNDVSGGLLDPAILAVAARRDAVLILGHLRGTPATMNAEARYTDVVAEVKAELGARIEAARAAGVAQERIWIDPGLGFAKHAEHSLSVLAHLDALRSLGCPIVVGASRKSFLASVEPAGLPTDAREEATAAANAIAVWLGADVLRVHDVRRQRAALRVAEALARARA
jgi:dihydropteroate synthase